ncbi:hypothetical protein BVRB_042880, partial [Beta vulgaris subsp. vulgaris]
MAMLHHPIPEDSKTVIATHASSLLASTSDPGCLVRVLWSLAVYDMLDDIDLVLSSIMRLENLFTGKHLSYCHDVLQRLLPSVQSAALDSLEFKSIVFNSRRIRSRLYPSAAEFKS